VLLTQLEKECLKYFLELMKTSDMVMITNELSPCKMATTVKAICKTLLNSSRAVSAANFKLQLKGLENQILNAITYLKQQRKIWRMNYQTILHAVIVLLPILDGSFVLVRLNYSGKEKETNLIVRLNQLTIKLEIWWKDSLLWIRRLFKLVN
jgi:hypothetical protein